MRSWPLFDLCLRTPSLCLRLPVDTELDALAQRAGAEGVLDSHERDFMGAWTQLPPGEFERGLVQHHWRALGGWQPSDWNLLLGVYPNGETDPVGVIGIGAKNFALSRSVSTGSWLLPGWRGRGLGKQARTAVLHLAFVHLDALDATSGAHPDNLASHGVSRTLGYRTNGASHATWHGYRVEVTDLILAAEDFRPACDVHVEGLTGACIALFGAATGAD